MAKTTKQLLEELHSEAEDVRDNNDSVSSGLVKKGEVRSSPNESEQDIENESEPDEDSETAIADDEESEEEEEESDEEVVDRKNQKPLKTGNELNAARRIIERQQEQISDLASKIESFQEAKTQEQQKEIGVEIAELATELKLDPKGLEKIMNKTVEIAERRIASKLPPQELFSKFEQSEEAEYFEQEFNEPKVQSFIETNYPRASGRQLQEAKALLDELAHDPQTGGRVVVGKNGKERLEGYPLDYIMWQHQTEFDQILSSKKRHGLESANVAGLDETKDTPDLSSNRGVDALDKKYRALETSGLRRGRSQQDRGSI